MTASTHPELNDSPTAAPPLFSVRHRGPAAEFPVPLTVLIGRQDDVAAIKDLLRRDDVRLLVLTGPGGVGKTRLALQAATELRADFADGSQLVPLAAIRTPAEVLPAIADALGIREAPAQPIVATLAAALRELHLLLLLDNVEHVVETAPRITDLLARCPRLTVLATSRSVLDVQGEHLYPVLPLSHPQARPADATAPLAAAQIADSAAVQLFVDRARAVRPSFALTDGNADAVARICERLDGLPLALELAAARVGVLSPAELAARLERRLPLLNRGPRDLPARLQTMRDAIRWSYDLLSPAEQALFRRLAVFVDGWTIEAAEAVASEESAVRSEENESSHSSLLTPHSVLDGLDSLLAKSLIQQVDGSGTEPRFSLLGTIREFALEELTAAGEADEIGHRHAAHFGALAERAEPELTGADQADWLSRLEADHANLRAAIAWHQATGAADDSLRLAKALWRFGYTRGHVREARAWLESALDQAPDPNPTRAAALNGAGILAAVQGDLDRAEAFHTEALDLAQRREAPPQLAAALNGLGDVASARGDHELATECYEAALVVYRQIDDRRGVAALSTNLGNLAWDTGDLERAAALHEQAGALYDAIGERRGLAWSASNLGRLAIERGDPARATPHLRAALDLYRELGDRAGIAETLEGCAEVAAALGDPARGATLLGAGDAIRATIGAPVPPNDRPHYDAAVEAIRRRLGNAFDAAWQTGRGLSADDAATLTSDPIRAANGPMSVPGQSERQAAIARLGLTPRELDVLRLLADGKTDREIATALFVSTRTVQTHLANVYAKLQVGSRAAATSFAIREHIVD